MMNLPPRYMLMYDDSNDACKVFLLYMHHCPWCPHQCFKCLGLVGCVQDQHLSWYFTFDQ